MKGHNKVTAATNFSSCHRTVFFLKKMSTFTLKILCLLYQITPKVIQSTKKDEKGVGIYKHAKKDKKRKKKERKDGRKKGRQAGRQAQGPTHSDSEEAP